MRVAVNTGPAFGLALFACVTSGLASSFVIGSSEHGNRPVARVVKLLKDMVTQLSKEGEEDDETYDALMCWCKTNDKEKTKSNADNAQRIKDLESSIDELTAKSSRLNGEIEDLNKEIAKNEGAVSTATELRKKQLAEFVDQEKSMVQSITGLKSGIITLMRGRVEFLQNERSAVGRTMAMLDIAAMLQQQLRNYRNLLGDSITLKQRKIIGVFMQAPDDYFDEEEPSMSQQAQQTNSGAPTSQILGIMKQMLESFEANLESTRRQETRNQEAYEDLKSAKGSEITASSHALELKTGELTEGDKRCAIDKQDLIDTRNTLEEDTRFLADLKVRCQESDRLYAARTEVRQEEIQAVSKAVAFLDSDDAKDLFARTLNSAFLQQTDKSARLERDFRPKMLKVLSAVAQKFEHEKRLAVLAVKARIDAFGKVKESVQNMINKLEQESEEEIKHRDFCVEEFHSNTMDLDSKTRDKADLGAKFDNLKVLMDELTSAIEQLKSEVSNLQVQLKKAGEDREKENKDFQLVVGDARATQTVLKASLNVLQKFYNSGSLVEVAIRKGRSRQPDFGGPPEQFDEPKKKGAAGAGVMNLIEQVVHEAEEMEKEAVHAEMSSQQAYEDFVRDSNASYEMMIKDIMNKSKEKAEAEGDIVESNQELREVKGNIKELNLAKDDLHYSCDYTLKNFDSRQAARSAEVEALSQAIAMFSGGTFGALLQHA